MNKRELADRLEYFETSHMASKEDLKLFFMYDNPNLIFDAANRVREAYVQNDVWVRGILEFSNYCNKSCFYCGIRYQNHMIDRYRMDQKEILNSVRAAIDIGVKTIVLQSGEDKDFSLKEMCRIIDKIKNMDVAITLSMGEFSTEQYKEMKRAGADRYLLKIETSNLQLYQKLHPGMDFYNRKRCLCDLKNLGYELGTGSLVGFPGQTIDMLIDDVFFFKELEADMVGIGIFIPCDNTPLSDCKLDDTQKVLKLMALTRILLPDINMPVTTALALKDPNGYYPGLKCGGNVIMINVGEENRRKLYKIYPDKHKNILSIENQIANVKKVVSELGRTLGEGTGGTVERRNSH